MNDERPLPLEEYEVSEYRKRTAGVAYLLL